MALSSATTQNVYIPPAYTSSYLSFADSSPDFFSSPIGSYYDHAAQSLIVIEKNNNRISKITTPSSGSSVRSLVKSDSTWIGPFGLWPDNQNNMFIGELGSSRIMKVTSGGVSTQFITSVTFNSPIALFGNSITNDLYVGEWAGNRISKIDGTSKQVTPIAGTGTCGFTGDNGAATSATFCNLWALFRNSAGAIFVTSRGSGGKGLRMIENGNVTTIAGEIFSVNCFC